MRAHLEVTRLKEIEVGSTRWWLKLETEQPTGSFKVRGALSALGADPDRSPVLACSAGNHALGVAWAAERLGVEACVVVSTTASRTKVDQLRSFAVELLERGSTYDEAETAALELAEARGARFISPYNDAHVIAGQATLATELLAQRPQLAHLVVAVGGGGLAAGCVLGLRGTGVIVHGAQVRQNAAFAARVSGEQPGPLKPTIADGIAGDLEPSSVTLQIVRDAGVELSLLEERDVRAAMRAAHEAGVRLEGSAAVALAAAVRDASSWDGEVVVVASGGNVDDEVLAGVLAEGLEEG